MKNDFCKVNSQQPVEIMSLKLSEDATTILAILFLLYSVASTSLSWHEVQVVNIC